MNALPPTNAAVDPATGAGGQPRRLTSGGLIDRSRLLRGRFDDRVLTGFAGDTLASALLAAGERLVARSFKYHRPRGILAAGSEEPNALVELRSGARREPNLKATTIELYEGLEACSQNRWPSLRFDLLAAGSWLGPLLAAGFYYKTFMWPASFWERVYEPLIRRAAGLGRAAGNERSRSLRAGSCVLRHLDHRRRAERVGCGACGRAVRCSGDRVRRGFSLRRQAACRSAGNRRHARAAVGEPRCGRARRACPKCD